MNYSKAKVNKQTQMSSLKYIDIAEGTVLNFKDIIDGEFEQNGEIVPNDSVKCVENGDGRTIKLPVREFLKMTTEGDLFQSEDGNDNVKFPKSITIKSKADREDRDGNVVFPLFAYNKAEEFLAEGSDLEWSDLLAGDLKADHGYSPVQDYTVTVQH